MNSATPTMNIVSLPTIMLQVVAVALDSSSTLDSGLPGVGVAPNAAVSSAVVSRV